tara:strand:+ start:665 stop:931 length:267 start_codon:yes stop_codon:yes gene_type:complete
MEDFKILNTLLNLLGVAIASGVGYLFTRTIKHSSEIELLKSNLSDAKESLKSTNDRLGEVSSELSSIKEGLNDVETDVKVLEKLSEEP